jgi:hypothetical protein
MGDRCSGTWVTHFESLVSRGLMLLGLWSCGDRVRDIHKSTGRLAASQIDGGDVVGTEVDAEHAVDFGPAQRHELAAKRPAQAYGVALEADEPGRVDLAHDVVGSVLDRRQNLGEHPQADAIAAERWLEAQGFMRPLAVVDRPPAVERILALGQVAEAPRP